MKKTVLITGSAKRIGKEMALHLAKNGFDVALHYHQSGTEAKSLKDEILALGRKAITLKANLLKEDEIQTLIQNATEALGSITCLINNASIYEEDTLSSFTKASWDKHFMTNSFAPLYLSQAFATLLPENVKGNIINIADSATIRPRREKVFTYQLSKALMQQATELLATQLPQNITVNTVALGIILKNKTESTERFLQMQANCPLKKGADMDDLLQAIDFILAAKSMTGVTIPIDGGKWTN